MRSWFDWLFRDRRTGHVTIVQFPNVALWIFFVTVALRRVVSGDGGMRSAIGYVGVAALGWWAVDEVVRGVNPWRRVLGLGGCVLTVAGLVSLLVDAHRLGLRRLSTGLRILNRSHSPTTHERNHEH